ncbi:MAG: prepilin peptidase, partial [Patescibacteria group bacterium]
LFLGWPNILAAMFFAFSFGAAVGLALILSRKKTLKSEIPFGPFLVAGTFFAFFFGVDIISWYLNLFLV